MSSNEDSDEILARAAKRAARGPAPLLASLIETWRKGVDDGNPAAELSISERTLSELALCRRPSPEGWVDDVNELARDLRIEADRLMVFLRTAETMERFRTAHPADESQAGRLLAARDHDEHK